MPNGNAAVNSLANLPPGRL